jgi:hypothetical protein
MMCRMLAYLLPCVMLVACEAHPPAPLPCDEEMNQQAAECPLEDFMQFNNVDDNTDR